MKPVLPPNPAKGWTRDDITALLDKSDAAVGRALLAILARQTFDEQQSHDTKHHNGVGFSAFDAPIMTSMAKFYRKAGFLTPKQLGWLRSGTPKRPAPRIHKYAQQLADIANAKVETQILKEEVREYA